MTVLAAFTAPSGSPEPLPSPDSAADLRAVFEQWRAGVAGFRHDMRNWREDTTRPDAIDYTAELDAILASLMQLSEALGVMADKLRAVGYGAEIEHVMRAVAPGSRMVH